MSHTGRHTAVIVVVVTIVDTIIAPPPNMQTYCSLVFVPCNATHEVIA